MVVASLGSALPTGPSPVLGSRASRPLSFPARRRPSRPPAHRRSLHLVDIENLVGAPEAWNSANVQAVLSDYLSAARWRPEDSLVVAANPIVMAHAAFELKGIPHRCLCGTGPDAADHLLLQAVPNDLVARYDRLVVGSGDHAFAPMVLRLKGWMPTLVVRSAGRLSADLYAAADEVVEL